MKFSWNGKEKENNSCAQLAGEKGFSLIEVLVALFVFALFMSTFSTVMGYGVFNSSNMRERAFLKELCQRKINEIIGSPPASNPGLAMKAQTKNFEDKDIIESDDDGKEGKDYSYTITYKTFKLPDLGKIMGTGNEEGEEGGGGAIQKRIFGIAKKHMEKLIWQVEVKVESKNTKRTFSLSSWLYNSRIPVEITL